MTENIEFKILFLETIRDNENNKLTDEDFFKLINHRIGWIDFNELKSNFMKNLVIDSYSARKLTDLGVNRLEEYKLQLKQILDDERVERTKLYNESKIALYTRKTFFTVFIFGLLGGLYSSYDFFIKDPSIEEKFQKIESDILKNKDTIKELRTLILTQKKEDS